MSGPRASFVALSVSAVLLAGSAAATASVTPASLEETADPGATVGPITKTVTTPGIAPNPDIVFVIDQTTSMGPAIDNVKAGLAGILSSVATAQPDAQFAVTVYKDQVDSPPIFDVRQGLTGDVAAVTTAVNSISLAGGGADAPEDYIYALFQLASGAISFRPDSTRFAVLVGDSSSHDPSAGVTQAAAIAALEAEGVHVLAIDVGPTPGTISNGLDATGQAGAITTATGGQYAAGAATETSTLILDALQSQPVTVTHSLSECSPDLTVSLTPPSVTVISGADAVFTETITVAADAPQATTLTCTVEFLIDGRAQALTQSISVEVNDVTPPVVVVDDQTVEATGPDGATVDLGATAVDNVDGPLTPDCTPPSGSTFSIEPTTPGIHVVLCSATDAAGNTGSDEATITIVDTIPPVLSLPSDVTVEATGPGGAVVDFTATATDIVDVTVPVDCNPPPGSLFPVGSGSTTTTVTCTATDMHGNSSSGTFDVTVQDTTPPITACPEGPNPGGNVPAAGRNPRSGQNPDGFYLLEAVDIVDLAPTVTVTDTGSGEVFGPFPSGTTIKYVQAASGPSIKAGPGDVDWHIKGTGDAAVVGTDFAGNSSDPVDCLVPRPPK
jgi:hypothetical protein